MTFHLIKDIPLAPKTTFRIGGNAQYFCSPESLHELTSLLRWASEEGLPLFCLGNGSNVLIDDAGFQGLVLRLSGQFQRIVMNESNGTLSVGAGCSLIKLGFDLVNRGCEGFEFMCCIPGTVGAAVRLNAGTKEGEISQRLMSVEILQTDLSIRKYNADELVFKYRYSNLLSIPGILIRAEFQTGPRESVPVLRERVKNMIEKRKRTQPRIVRNCGSVFKNPNASHSAGWYIENAGLKGVRKGDAQIAREHANWIVNLGNASASDVKSLIQYIQGKVNEQFGVQLNREVIYVPDDII